MRVEIDAFGVYCIPAGWRQLEIGETVKSGDMVLNRLGTNWLQCSMMLGNKVKSYNNTFIRKLEDPTEELEQQDRPERDMPQTAAEEVW